MANRVEIKKNDKNRILHTEVLPYEVPLFFSNDSLYQYATHAKKLKPPHLVELFMGHDRFTIPFEYHIRHGVSSRRSLGIIHPATQLRFADFYEDYHQILLSLCGKSDYSLRSPFRVASHFVERNLMPMDNSLKDDNVDVDTGEETVPLFASSYFSYGKYSQLHKFIDSTEFISLERQFSKLFRFDVKKCFASIYSHSICWAIKGKEYSKNNRGGDSFDGVFDRLMQNSNYDETNGILVGPEVSRIFAEIILQQIDLNIADGADAAGFKKDSFFIRRYVDDYFLFANDDKTLQSVFHIAQNELQIYKLYINETKTLVVDRPFSTPESAAKANAQSVLSSTILEWLKEFRQNSTDPECGSLLSRGAELQLRTPFRLSTKIVRDIKIAVKQSNVNFSVVTGYALGAITKELWRLRRKLDAKLLSPQDSNILKNLLLVTIEVLVFFLSMDFRVRPTIRVAQCMVLVNIMTRRYVEMNSDIIERFVRQANDLLLARSKEGAGGVEAINLLITLRALKPELYLSSTELLAVMAGRERQGSVDIYQQFSYFDISAIIFYVADQEIFEDIKKNIECELVQRFSRNDNQANKAEICMLFMDMVRCPWISKETKDKIIDGAYRSIKKKVPGQHEIGHIREFVKKNIGFIDWNGIANFEKALSRKELRVAYDM